MPGIPPLRRRTTAAILTWAVVLGLVAAGGLTAAEARAAKSGKEKRAAGEEISFDDLGFHATTFGRSTGDMVIVQYWSRGLLFRSETIVAGHPIITLVDAKQYYTWDGLTLAGFVVRRTPSAVALDSKRTRPFGLELDDLMAEGGEKVRSEALNGIQADVYRVTDDGGRRTLWVTADQLRLPLRMETFERKTGRNGRLDWVSWRPGLMIPDGFFAPPRELKLRRFDSYEDYVAAMQQAPVLPTPPLFHYLLHQPEAE